MPMYVCKTHILCTVLYLLSLSGCWSVGRLVVCWMDCQNFLKGRKVSHFHAPIGALVFFLLTWLGFLSCEDWWRTMAWGVPSGADWLTAWGTDWAQVTAYSPTINQNRVKGTSNFFLYNIVKKLSAFCSYNLQLTWKGFRNYLYINKV